MSLVIWTHHMCTHNQQLQSASNADRQSRTGLRVSDVDFGHNAHSVPDTDVGQASLDTDIRTSVMQMYLERPPRTRL